jgi:glycosyltransferase involved in cell wall biosynthesis
VHAARVRGLASAVASTLRLAGLDRLLTAADVVHVQNVMNPVALRLAVATSRAVVTIQDHRVLCPSIGKTTPDGSPCLQAMGADVCGACLPDADYRARMLELTAARRDALRGARLIVLSRYVADALAVVGLAGAEVLPPWVEVGHGPANAGDGFVLAGRLVRHKAVEIGWEAWLRAGQPAALRVAGDGPMADCLAGAELKGWLAHHELRRLLRSSRALLFPGLWQEPFGIVGVETLAEGTPVVLAATGGVDDWAGAGCVRVAPGDVEAMARVIARLAADPDEALRLGEEGREAVRRGFSRNRIERRLLEIYGEVAG